jgi:hypothetical protein
VIGSEILMVPGQRQMECFSSAKIQVDSHQVLRDSFRNTKTACVWGMNGPQGHVVEGGCRA